MSNYFGITTFWLVETLHLSTTVIVQSFGLIFFIIIWNFAMRRQLRKEKKRNSVFNVLYMKTSVGINSLDIIVSYLVGNCEFCKEQNQQNQQTSPFGTMKMFHPTSPYQNTYSSPFPFLGVLTNEDDIFMFLSRLESKYYTQTPMHLWSMLEKSCVFNVRELYSKVYSKVSNEENFIGLVPSHVLCVSKTKSTSDEGAV